MTSTYISANTIGAGTQFTYAANNDVLVVLPGVTLASTTVVTLNFNGFTGLGLEVLGTLASPAMIVLPSVDTYIGSSGSIVSNEPTLGNAGLFLGTGARLINDGSIIAPKAIGILADGGVEIMNHGSITAGAAVFLGRFGSEGDNFVNSGTITSNGGISTRLGNGVFSEGAGTLITNLASGSIVAMTIQAAGVRLSGSAGDSVVRNWGAITSQQDFGVDFGGITSGQVLARLANWGTITGLDGSFNGSVNADRVVNRGTLEGNVLMGDGADTLDARGGTLDGDWFGGAGNDLYLGMQDTVVYGDILGDAGNDTLNGGDLADTFFGGDDNDRINGFGGEDKLFGDAGNDILSGGVANDVLNGDAGNDILSGGIGDDALLGGDATDNLRGNDGADRLEGEAGGDVLAGGLGLDTFVFAATADSSASVAANRDQITDFLSGQDIIDLTGIDARSGTAGNQAFAFIGTAAFSGTAGELRYTAASGLVSADVNGDGVADFGFVLSTRPTSLVASDFLL